MDIDACKNPLQKAHILRTNGRFGCNIRIYGQLRRIAPPPPYCRLPIPSRSSPIFFEFFFEFFFATVYGLYLLIFFNFVFVDILRFVFLGFLCFSVVLACACVLLLRCGYCFLGCISPCVVTSFPIGG